MGGGDLNTKKSWHPSTFKNQERVWKAEQADAAEKRKLAELQHEINAERNREELKSIAKKSGLLASDGDGDRKLEWMYKGPQVNREEYLLGRAVDRNFEQLDAQEKAASSSSVGITQPKNHVEHECIPFSIREYKGLEGTEQVDMARKLMEDPLMAIKQKEVENRQKILENPVKLKELHRLLKSDQSIKDSKGKKKEKKVKKKKSKKKKHGSDASDNSDSDNEGKDLDKILAEKYKKVQNSMGDKEDNIGLDKLLSMKYQKLSKELNKMAKPKKSKKKKDSEDSASDSDSNKDRMQSQRSHGRESYRAGPSKPRERSRSNDRRERHNPRRSRSPQHRRTDRRSPDNRRRDRDRPRSRDRRRSPEATQSRPRGRRTPVPSSSSSSESSPERSRQRRDDDDDEKASRPKPKQFGLVTAAGQKLELTKRDEVRLYKREEIKAHQSSQKPTWSRPERKAPLTEEEMEAKRRAMMSNAEWRDKERERNVKRYDDEERKQDERDREKKYDKEFMRKQFKHAAGYETVEKRIKSNRNNIQRAGGAMNDNFAKR